MNLQKVCQALKNLSSDSIELTSVEYMTGKNPPHSASHIPDHLRICITAIPEKNSHIGIEIWLPTEIWNGDLVGIGNGGAAGYIPSSMMTEPLKLGFAVSSTDLGTSAGPDCGIGNPAVWKDFGHRATHLMTVIAKNVIKVCYGAPARHFFRRRLHGRSAGAFRGSALSGGL